MFTMQWIILLITHDNSHRTVGYQNAQFLK